MKFHFIGTAKMKPTTRVQCVGNLLTSHEVHLSGNTTDQALEAGLGNNLRRMVSILI